MASDLRNRKKWMENGFLDLFCGTVLTFMGIRLVGSMSKKINERHSFLKLYF